MARNVSMSVGFGKWVIATNNIAVGDTLMQMKASDGKRIHPERYKPRTLEKMVKLNLLGVDPRGGYWQRSWEEIHQVLKLDELSFTTVTKRMLNKYDIRDTIYLIAFNYLFRLQGEYGRKPSGRHLQPSIHLGGIAHSLMASFFGMTIHWSYLRRQSCMARGLIIFERRTAPIQQFDAPPDTEVPYRSFEITSAADVRVKLDFFVPRFLRGKLKMKRFCPKEGCIFFS